MQQNALPISLFAIRITIFILMIVWASLKIFKPESYVGIYAGFYGADVGTSIVYAIGAAQILFLLAYLAGFMKFITYGGVMLMNLVTLVVSIPRMLPMGEQEPNLLFVASFPVFGASLAHFLLRDQDTMLAPGSRK